MLNYKTFSFLFQAKKTIFYTLEETRYLTLEMLNMKLHQVKRPIKMKVQKTNRPIRMKVRHLPNFGSQSAFVSAKETL